ncbi:hypothetical protein HJG60_010354 [Phyllostomus discolor]|uniref:Uncharacterized protein n=1 Tax=Phyllostomus discolor TaxID=89673 RepID=A0A834EJY4_9CHIR|nr:hypothetical protein HJG60_010354 [Phyllostomus discolor]
MPTSRALNLHWNRWEGWCRLTQISMHLFPPKRPNVRSPSDSPMGAHRLQQTRGVPGPRALSSFRLNCCGAAQHSGTFRGPLSCPRPGTFSKDAEQAKPCQGIGTTRSFPTKWADQLAKLPVLRVHGARLPSRAEPTGTTNNDRHCRGPLPFPPHPPHSLPPLSGATCK